MSNGTQNEAANAPLMIVSGKFGTPPDFVDRSNVEAAHQDYLRRVETSVVDNDVHTTLRLYSLPLAWHHLACKTCPDPIDWAARLWSGEDVFGQGASAGEGSGASKAKGNGGNSGQDDTAGAGGKTAEATVSSHGRQESSTEKCGEGKDIADESEFSSWLLNRE